MESNYLITINKLSNKDNWQILPSDNKNSESRLLQSENLNVLNVQIEDFVMELYSEKKSLTGLVKFTENSVYKAFITFE